MSFDFQSARGLLCLGRHLKCHDGPVRPSEHSEMSFALLSEGLYPVNFLTHIHAIVTLSRDFRCPYGADPIMADA